MSREKKTSQAAPTVDALLEGVILLDLWQDKMFIGQEFLTWLYLVSEKDNHHFELENGQILEAWFENSLQLSYGQGNNKRSVSITTPEEPRDTDWDEAYTAIGNNKRVIKGTLRIKTQDREWRLSLPHDTLSPQNLKLTAVKDSAENDDLGKAGKFLDRLGLTAELIEVLEGLFSSFLTQRLSSSWDNEELPRLKDYLSARK
jgi:recombination associated protein RdgC